MRNVRGWLPILHWIKQYRRDQLYSDLLAAVIVSVMLIPQSLAYAMLAGLPAEVGLYASMLPLVVYALFGTSNTLAVGPVAVLSLMTAATISQFGQLDPQSKLAAAAMLAILSGGMLLLFGVLRLGIIANFLSHPVIAGFITASGVIIALSQAKHLLGVSVQGSDLMHILPSLWQQLPHMHWPTLAIGLPTLAFLFWVRSGLKPLLLRVSMSDSLASMLSRTGPIFAIIFTVLIAWALALDKQGVAILGEVPAQLPSMQWPVLSWELTEQLLVPAMLIALIGFVESISVAQTLAAKRREQIRPNQELIALGASSLSAGVSQGFAVTGGFARSVVNFDAGARTPLAGAFTAIGIALATLLLTPLLAYLPKATLAATIIVAVLSLLDFSILKRAWAFSRADFSAVFLTILLTWLAGVEVGVITGVGVSLLLHLLRSARPHMAVVGQVEGTEHFRNELRHNVVIEPHVLSLRVDESLFFANAHYLEDKLVELVAERPQCEHVILQCTAVNSIDLSALESLQAMNQRLQDAKITLHLSEVKGPVMDRLKATGFLAQLSGRCYLTQYQAMQALSRSDYVI